MQMSDDLMVLERERQLLRAECKRYRDRAARQEARAGQLEAELAKARAVAALLESNASALADSALGSSGDARAKSLQKHLQVPHPTVARAPSTAVLTCRLPAALLPPVQSLRQLMEGELKDRDQRIKRLTEQVLERDLRGREAEARMKKLDALVQSLVREKLAPGPKPGAVEQAAVLAELATQPSTAE